MAPKKAKKITLNEFLGDSALGSWADEMDSLPNAPAPKETNEHFSRRDDFLSSRPERSAPVREDVPLPTQPPYTAFVGNLAFDLTEFDLEQFFGKVKSVKIIKDRDDKPKGFGYVEFEDLDGLKVALGHSGQALANRTIRVSVAEPPKERFHSSHADDQSKFDNPWRREGPLPDLPHGRDSSRRKFDSVSEKQSSVSDAVGDWRSHRPVRAAEPEPPSRRKAPGSFGTEPSAADKDEVWTIGSKFKPSTGDDAPSNRFGGWRSKAEPAAHSAAAEEGDWRSAARPRPHISPNNSTPNTPPMGRRKLDLLPRSGNPSATPSPLSSPKMGNTPPVIAQSRSNPFGAAKPVDVSAKEKEIAERLEKDRHSMSRTSSRTGTERPSARPRTPTSSTSPSATAASPRAPSRTLAPNVRPTLSFANVAASKDNTSEGPKSTSDEVDEVTEKTNGIQL